MRGGMRSGGNLQRSLTQLRLFVFVSALILIAGGALLGANASALDTLIGSRKRMIWTAVGVVFLGLWALLVLLVRRASRLLRRQNEELREHSANLEQSALEAVESLNATVDAKAPTPPVTRSGCSGSRWRSARSSASRTRS